jgi:hypothetical protein
MIQLLFLARGLITIYTQAVIVLRWSFNLLDIALNLAKDVLTMAVILRMELVLLLAELFDLGRYITLRLVVWEIVVHRLRSIYVIHLIFIYD